MREREIERESICTHAYLEKWNDKGTQREIGSLLEFGVELFNGQRGILMKNKNGNNNKHDHVKMAKVTISGTK